MACGIVWAAVLVIRIPERKPELHTRHRGLLGVPRKPDRFVRTTGPGLEMTGSCATAADPGLPYGPDRDRLEPAGDADPDAIPRNGEVHLELHEPKQPEESAKVHVRLFSIEL